MCTALLRAASPLLAVVIFASCGGDKSTKPVPIPGIVVPRDYPTPQAGVDAAEAGETVYLEQGGYSQLETRHIYGEAFPRGITAALFMKESVAVEGLGDLGGVVFTDSTGSDSTYGVVFAGVSENTVAYNLALEGFFTGALFLGNSGTLSLTRISGGDVGAWAFQAEQPWVVRCLIENTEFDGVLNQLSDMVIAANIIRNCAAGVGAELGGQAILQWNILCGNRVGLGANTGANPIAYQNVFIDNTYAGIKIETGAAPIVVENDIYDNPVGISVGFYAEPLPDTLNCTSNFWDTLDLGAIGQDLIHDRADDAGAGAHVAYRPISPSSFAGLFITFPPRNACGAGAGAVAPPGIVDPRATLARVRKR